MRNVTIHFFHWLFQNSHNFERQNLEQLSLMITKILKRLQKCFYSEVKCGHLATTSKSARLEGVQRRAVAD